MDSSDKNQSRQTITAKEGSTISNIVQAVIHLPAWAWIIGSVTLSVCLCVAIISASVVSNSRTLFPKSTPMAFNTATPEESLIIVANFEDRSNGAYTGTDHAQYIYEQLDAQVKKDKLNITVRRLDQVVDDNTAKSIGEAYHSTLVIWGWYDALTVTPRIERIKNLQGRTSDMEGFRLSLADPNKVEFEAITNLPNQVSYLVMFTIGADNIFNHKYTEALTYINNAIRIASTITNDTSYADEAYVYRGIIYAETKEYDLALADLNKEVELNPNYDFAYFARGLTYYNKEDYDHAITDYTRAIELNPKYENAYYNRGLAYFQKGDYEQSISDYDKALEINPNNATFYHARGFTYYTKGDTLQSMGNESEAKENYDLALADFSKGLEINPNDADFYYMRGLTYESMYESDKSIADYTQAIELKPDYAYAYMGRGNNYQYKGDYKNAISDFTKLIQLMPDYANAYFNRGNAYHAKGSYDQAIADYSKVIQLNPKDADAYINRGNTYKDKSDYNLAITDFTKAIELKPDYERAYSNRGLAYESLGQTSNAIKDFEKILEISTNPDWRKRAEDELKKLK